MKILIVDDAPEMRMLLKAQLARAGYRDVIEAGCAAEALARVDEAVCQADPPDLDLILMDLNMPGGSGLDACVRLKARDDLRDIPVIMVTAEGDPDDLKRAFEFGAADYVTKPIVPVVLLARVRNALRLKREMDQRKAREQELLATQRQLELANQRLKELATTDALTGLANRRVFDERLQEEWRRARRSGECLGLVMMDIDCFKAYNDHYGHPGGDACLRQVGAALQGGIMRSGDLVARYGGEEFVVLLPATDLEGTLHVADRFRSRVEALRLPHERASWGQVTLSAGAACLRPRDAGNPMELLQAADDALYTAKLAGRNRASATPQAKVA